MSRISRWVTPLFALGILLSLGIASATADDAKTTGSVSGTVTGADDKPVADAHVRLLPPMKHHSKAAKSDDANQNAADSSDAKPKRPQPVATATNDSDGKYELKDVPAGDYVVVANAKGQGTAHDKVTVTAGEDAKVDLKLEKHAGHGHHADTDQKKPDSGNSN